MTDCPNVETALRWLQPAKTIPSHPGIYVFTHRKDGVVLYVGQSSNLKKRLSGHQFYISKYVQCKILVCNNPLDVEEWLIEALSPLLNKTYERRSFKKRNWTKTMNEFSQAADLMDQLIPTILAPHVRREAQAVLHKLRHPMHDILAQVPGTSLTERAKRLKVSRQTMYVWLSEKFRPTRVQAKRIARVTGVPIEHIVDDGFEVANDAGRKARKKAARVATGRKKAAKREAGATPRRRRTQSDRHRVGQA